MYKHFYYTDVNFNTMMHTTKETFTKWHVLMFFSFLCIFSDTIATRCGFVIMGGWVSVPFA